LALPGKSGDHDFVITLTTDISGPLAGVEQLLGEDLPFTIARFLTMQAQSGQEATRGLVKNVFTNRNDWTVKNIKITPATKQSQFSEVYTDTENRKTGAGDYLPRQDEGGERVPLAGHSFLAIPTRYLRKIVPGIIPASFRPRNLLPPGAELGKAYAGKFRAPGRSATPYPRTQAQHLALSNGEYVAFAQTTRGGTLCIFVRHGGIGYHGGSQDAEPWYTLIREAYIKPRFPMEEIVAKALEANLEKNFDRAAAEVLVNNALASGLRVRF
jgi:hypothetical protein